MIVHSNVTEKEDQLVVNIGEQCRVKPKKMVFEETDI